LDVFGYYQLVILFVNNVFGCYQLVMSFVSVVRLLVGLTGVLLAPVLSLGEFHDQGDAINGW
jgi:hypothetical protein